MVDIEKGLKSLFFGFLISLGIFLGITGWIFVVSWYFGPLSRMGIGYAVETFEIYLLMFVPLLTVTISLLYYWEDS